MMLQITNLYSLLKIHGYSTLKCKMPCFFVRIQSYYQMNEKINFSFLPYLQAFFPLPFTSSLSLSHTSFETIFHKRTAVVLSCTYRVIVTAQKSFQPSQTLLEQVWKATLALEATSFCYKEPNGAVVQVDIKQGGCSQTAHHIWQTRYLLLL